MTISQAYELVRLFWPNKMQKKYHDKIMDLYPEKKWFFMCIGSPNTLTKNNQRRNNTSKIDELDQ